MKRTAAIAKVTLVVSLVAYGAMTVFFQVFPHPLAIFWPMLVCGMLIVAAGALTVVTQLILFVRRSSSN